MQSPPRSFWYVVVQYRHFLLKITQNETKHKRSPTEAYRLVAFRLVFERRLVILTAIAELRNECTFSFSS